MPDTKLSTAQIQNWRRVLLSTLGPYALIMPEEQIQAYRDRLQSTLEAEGLTKDTEKKDDYGRS